MGGSSSGSIISAIAVLFNSQLDGFICKVTDGRLGCLSWSRCSHVCHFSRPGLFVMHDVSMTPTQEGRLIAAASDMVNACFLWVKQDGALPLAAVKHLWKL